MPVTTRAGAAINWTTFGTGPRDALLIHRGLGRGADWEAVSRGLAGTLSMTAFDMPGHGRSAPWDGEGEVQGRFVGIAAEFLEGPTDVIGHSFGATVALRLAVENPGMVRALVLIEPVFFAAALADHPQLRARLDTEFADVDAAQAAGDRLAAARAFTAIWGGGAAWEEIPEKQQLRLADGMPLIEATGPELFDDKAGLLEPGRLEALDIPVLLLQGNASPWIIEAISESLAARLPRAERAMIVGAGHMAPLTHAKQVASEIGRFLSLV